MSIRTRLIVNYIGMVLVILSAISVYLNYSLKEMLDTRITNELGVQGNLTRQFLIKTLPDTLDYDTIDALVDDLGTTTTVRLTFIGPDGIVWGDTERHGENLRQMDNHQNRPEVQDALLRGSGIIDRYSDTVKSHLRYFALPVFRQGEIVGICRVALPMKEVSLAIVRLRRVLWLTSGIGLVGAILLSIGIAGRIAKPIRELTQTTQAIAAGEIASRVSVSTSDELGQLSRHFNQMAHRIDRQIQALSQERDRLDTILSKMVEGVLLLGETFGVAYANPAAITMLNLPDNYQTRSLIEINRNPDLQHMLEQARDAGTIGRAEIGLPGELTERETVITVVPIIGRADAVISGYVVVFHDVSQLRKLERIRADFVANVSHELRTPLTAIQGYAETLFDGALTDTKTSQRFVEKILQQSSRLSQLVSDLLDLSRLESGGVQLKLEPCRIKDFRYAIRTLFDPVFDESNLTFEWNAPDDLPTVLADKHLLGQVFVNLIDNAIKYTPSGGSITVAAESSDSTVIVHVSDTGLGIPSEAAPRIFERFYRVDKGRSREMGGTGLGLSIARHILLQHGGRIWVDSVLGSGSTFHFVLPLRPS